MAARARVAVLPCCHDHRELDDGGQTRIDKIFALIEQCRYGIHDLSPTELDAVNNLPRFNMPLELGLFLGPSATVANIRRSSVS